MNLYLAKETMNSFTKGKVKLLHPKVEKNDLLFVSASLFHLYDRGLLLGFVFFGQNKDKIFSRRAALSPLAPLLHVVFCSPDVQHIVAPHQNLSQVSSAGAVDELLGVGQLQVHVSIRGDQEALVLMSPLQLNHDSLASEPVEEGLWVHGHRRHPGSRIALSCRSESSNKSL